jgi:hypothetical protein
MVTRAEDGRGFVLQELLTLDPRMNKLIDRKYLMAYRTPRAAFAVIVKISLAMAAAALAACGGGGGDTASTTSASQGSADALKAKRIATPGLIVGEADQVNTTSGGDQTVRAVGALSDGGYAVAWFSGTDATTAVQLFLQHYDNLGRKAGAEILLPLSLDSQAKPAIAVMRDGGVLVSYASSRPVAGAEPWIVNSSIYTRRFDAAGAATGGEVQVASITQNTQGAQALYYVADPAIATWDDGKYLIAWASIEDSYVGKVPTFQAQRYDSTGSALGARISAGRGEVNTSFKLTAIPDGRYAMATYHSFMGQTYVTFGIGDGGGRIGLMYDADFGLPASGTTLLPLGDGRFALWSRNRSGAYVQALDQSGVAAGSPTALAALPESAGALGNGGYATFTRTAVAGTLVGQRFDSTGAALGDAFEFQAGSQPPMTASLMGGGLAMGWTAAGSAGDLDVFTRRFQDAAIDAKTR